MLPLLPLLIAFHTLTSPYTKVEESFTLHAVRDLLLHGRRIEQYDHLRHPGPLPRSFLPPLLLAGLSKPLVTVLNVFAPIRNPMVDQLLIRLILGLLNAYALTRVAKSLQKAFGKTEARVWVGFVGTGFHVVWWAGRTVPNMVAMVGATLALSYLIDAFAPSTLPTHRKRHIIRATTLLALTASIVRAETALLLAGVILALFIKESCAKTRYEYTRAAIVTTAVAGLAGTVLSIAVDSYFWSTWLLQNRATEHLVTVPGLRGTIERGLRGVGFGTRWIWPELWGVLFNVVEGKSELWGTSPWYTYLFPFLPKLLLSALPLVVAVPVLDPAARRALKGWKTVLGVPVGAMVAGMSCLPHKEWRFIVYVVPWIHALAAISCGQIWRARRRHQPTVLFRLLLLALVGGMVANIFVTAGLAYISHHNYPGGKAMEALHQVHQSLVGAETAGNQTVRVFLPPGPRMTGASSFTQLYAPPRGRWEYNTTESLNLVTPQQIWDAGFDYVVTDELEAYRDTPLSSNGQRWTQVRAVEAFAGVERRKGIKWREEVGVFARPEGLSRFTHG
ncbi:hypothetical protein QFC20_005961 [Naganishia adeliensis]|uniref:Uncharacterized protein n=1 Tax=Naganishia adeliensis TaxID=92952 RepID=A0ACC2VHN4_9TREE|nr:hypothetical protein QFC20_005961 [Naganishia adeliensis]